MSKSTSSIYKCFIFRLFFFSTGSWFNLILKYLFSPITTVVNGGKTIQSSVLSSLTFGQIVLTSIIFPIAYRCPNKNCLVDDKKVVVCRSTTKQLRFRHVVTTDRYILLLLCWWRVTSENIASSGKSRTDAIIRFL